MTPGGRQSPLFRQCFAAAPGELPHIKAGVLAAARRAGWAGDGLNRLELVLEEAAVNVILYAYPDGGGEFDVELRSIDGGLMLCFEDGGVPFDPAAAGAPELGSLLAQRPVGGLGIYLMKQMANAVTYRRQGDRNVLEIKFQQDCGAE